MRKGNINNKSEKIDKCEIIKNTQSTDDNKNKDKIRIIILIILVVIAIGTTVGLLIYKYLKVNDLKTDNTVLPDVIIESKKETEDKKYLVSFKDMYTTNPLIITNKNYEQEATKKQGNIYIEYIQIAGLQDKQLQERINNKIKDNAFYNSDKINSKQEYRSYTDVKGNFSNILSIHTYIYIYENNELVSEENISLNYNLATGEQIKFLDLFASNTPMNSIIYDLEYERLAWDTEFNFDMSEKEWDKATNMDNRDTSEYEDVILKAINRYKNLDKDKINFFVTPNKICVTLAIGEGTEEISYIIKLYKYIDYITMYKKFLTDKVIYESEPSNKLLVFNDMMGYEPEYYKFESDNLFMSVFSFGEDEYKKEEEKEQVEKYSQSAVNKKNELMQKFIDKTLSDVKSIAKSNKDKGYMARFMPYCGIEEYDNEYGSEVIIYISLSGAFEEMMIDYYNDNALKLLAKQNIAPKVSIDELFAGRIAYHDKNVKSLVYNEDGNDALDLTAYYTLDGKLVASTYEEVEEYINNKYKAPEVEPEQVPEQPEVNVYKEEQ